MMREIQHRAEAIREIKNEVNILKEVHHPHIVQLIATEQLEDRCRIVMDLAEGNLENHLGAVENNLGGLAREGRDQIPPWFRCLLNGIAYFHKQNVRHRDIEAKQYPKERRQPALHRLWHIKHQPGQKRYPRRCWGSLARERASTARRRWKVGTVAVDLGTFSRSALCSWRCLRCTARPGELAKFRKSLLVDDRQSFARNPDKISEWLDALEVAPLKEHWHATVLFLCRKMLQAEPYDRPSADDLCPVVVAPAVLGHTSGVL